MKSSTQDLIQHFIVSTSFPPITYLYGKTYTAAVKLATSQLRRVKGVLAIYLRRGLAKGEVVYGLSDIDLLVIASDQEERAAKEKVRATYDRLSRFVPLFGNADKELGVYSTTEFLKLYHDYDFYRYRFNDGKGNWKLLYGQDLVKSLSQVADTELYLPATEELKPWWGFLTAEFTPDSTTPLFRRKYLWYKAIAEAARIYLFVCHGKKVHGRADALNEVKNYLTDEYRSQIDRLQGYLKHLTARDELIADHLMPLFIMLVAKTFGEMEQRVSGHSPGKTAVVNAPDYAELVADNNLAKIIEEVRATAEKDFAPNLVSVILIPQVEFNTDVLDNSDIDAFYLALMTGDYVPVEKLRGFLSRFGQTLRAHSIEPFIVNDGEIALSLRSDRPQHCIKSPLRDPLFFASLSTPNRSVKSIRCHLPNTFEETIKKRTARINEIAADKSIYKMKTLDFLRFFWAAARTKLLARSLSDNEIHVPLTSHQILDSLIRAYPDDSDWLKSLHIEYNKALLGKENESYQFFTQSVEFLNRMQ